MELLIIKPSSLGDIIHGLQAAQSLKNQRPDVRITWVVREIFAPLVEACACVDAVIVFHRKTGISGLRQCIGEIRQHRYDWVWDMQGLARSGLMTWRARAAKKAGRRDSREGARLAYQVMPELPPAGRQAHALDILLQFLPLLGLEPRIDEPLRFREGKTENLPPEVAGSVVLFPGSRRAEKEWPGFAALTEKLLTAEPACRIVWAGDQPVTAPAEWPRERFLNLTAKTTLPELLPLIAGARLCVCNDSGPMHLAAALGTELVAIFGPTPPERFGPWPLENPCHHVVRAPEGGLAVLEVEEVFAAVEQALGQPASVRLVRFESRHAEPFRSLNLAWIEKYFAVEEQDRRVLDDPERTIVEPGGDIVVAEAAGQVVGVGALQFIEPGYYELAKMAVDPSWQGQGIGRQLMTGLIARARELGAKRVLILSNTRLGPALHLYRAFGFHEIPIPPDQHYQRVDAALELKL